MVKKYLWLRRLTKKVPDDIICSLGSTIEHSKRQAGRKQLEVLYARLLDLQNSEDCKLVILRLFLTVCALS